MPEAIFLNSHHIFILFPYHLHISGQSVWGWFPLLTIIYAEVVVRSLLFAQWYDSLLIPIHFFRWPGGLRSHLGPRAHQCVAAPKRNPWAWLFWRRKEWRASWWAGGARMLADGPENHRKTIATINLMGFYVIQWGLLGLNIVISWIMNGI